jgi:hypothetical protein
MAVAKNISLLPLKAMKASWTPFRRRAEGAGALTKHI